MTMIEFVLGSHIVCEIILIFQIFQYMYYLILIQAWGAFLCN